MATLRIGILGTSRVAGYAVIQPAATNADVEVIVVAGRDVKRTQAYAGKHGVGEVGQDYQSVVDSDQVDAVYIPLPNALHHTWILKALAAGKHVLCEKPLVGNQQQAIEVRDAARARNLVVMEGFHYRHHPLMQRLLELRSNERLGALQHLDAAFCLFWPNLKDIRFSYELAGGALMDIGCYPVDVLRTLVGREATVSRASARLVRHNVDASMQADISFVDGPTARMRCSLRAWPWQWRSWLRMQFQHGEVRVVNPFVPHAFHRLRVRTSEGTRTAKIEGPNTYAAQLDAFVAATRGTLSSYPGATEAVGNAGLIDAIYLAAGLDPRCVINR